MTDIADVLARLERLEAIEAIRDLAHRYSWGADHRDVEVWRSVWTPDAVWQVGPEQSFTGADEIAEAVAWQWRTFPQMLHATSNHRISVSGEAATGLADVVVMVCLGAAEEESIGDDDSGAGRWVSGGGTYRDTYVRIDGEWLISRREATDSFLTGPHARFPTAGRAGGG